MLFVKLWHRLNHNGTASPGCTILVHLTKDVADVIGTWESNSNEITLVPMILLLNIYILGTRYQGNLNLVPMILDFLFFQTNIHFA